MTQIAHEIAKKDKREEKERHLQSAVAFVERAKAQIKEIEDILDSDKTLSNEERKAYKAQIKAFKGYVFIGNLSPKMAYDLFTFGLALRVKLNSSNKKFMRELAEKEARKREEEMKLFGYTETVDDENKPKQLGEEDQ